MTPVPTPDSSNPSQLLREFADTLPQTVFEVEPDGRLVYVNRPAYALWGYSPEEVASGLNVIDLIVEEQRATARQNMVRSLRGEVSGHEYLAQRKDGSRFPVIIHARPARVATGVAGLRGLVVDITEAKQAEAARRTLEEQLRHAQKMEAIGRLAGGIAHDFNNLLTAILGYSEMLVDTFGPADARRGEVLEIKHAAERAASLTRQLMTFSRKDAGQPSCLDLNAVVSSFETMLRRVIGEDVTLVTVLDPSLGAVCADRGRIEQVVMNLVINARDAMPAGGVLRLVTRNAVVSPTDRLDPPVRPGRYAVVEVHDDGCGMSPDVKARLFEPFFTTKSRDKGTGLGLATVYGIVQQAGGYVRVWSELERGSVFAVHLPCVGEQGSNSPVPKHP